MLNSSKNVNNGENDSLIAYAEAEGIPVFYGNIPFSKSMSVWYNNRAYIAIDPSLVESSADGKVKIGHELGHCQTGSFYTRWSPVDVLEKHEYRADKWAAHKLIPPETLQRVMREGYTELWQIAERLDVTECFVERAIGIYQNEGWNFSQETGGSSARRASSADLGAQAPAQPDAETQILPDSDACRLHGGASEEKMYKSLPQVPADSPTEESESFI